MSVRNSLLAILALEPCYGYQLKQEFEKRIGGAWPIHVSQIYSTLDRLERDRMLVKDDETDGQTRFAITNAGRAEVRDWFDSPIIDSPGSSRNDLATKIALAITLPDVDVERLIQIQRRAAVTQLQELNRIKRSSLASTSHEEIAWQLVIDSLLFTQEAQVRWLDHTESRILRLREESIELTFPLSTDLPRRGRPRIAAREAEPENQEPWTESADR